MSEEQAPFGDLRAAPLSLAVDDRGEVVAIRGGRHFTLGPKAAAFEEMVRLMGAEDFGDRR